MKNFLARLLLVLLCLGTVPAFAQVGSRVVQTCGTLPLAYSPGSNQPPTIDVNGNICNAPPGGSAAVAVTNCGGTIATGGTAQQLFAATAFKQGFILEIGANDSNTDALYFSDATTTLTPGAGVAGSWSVGPSTSTAPGGSFTSPLNFPVGARYMINGATTGDAYKCRVW